MITLTSFSNELINAEPSNKIPLWSKILIDWWLEEKISDISNVGIAKESQFMCEECEESFMAGVAFDPVNFSTAS